MLILTETDLFYPIIDTMLAVWLLSPREFQKQIITHLLQMRCLNHQTAAVLLVHVTGGGKSAVLQTVGIVDAVVVLIIEKH